MKIDQVYCTRDYWLDYSRTDKIEIEHSPLTVEEKERIRKGKIIFKQGIDGNVEYYCPIRYNNIIN